MSALDFPSEAAEDHFVTGTLQALQDKGIYSEAMGKLTPEQRQAVEDAVDRHAARQRAKGKAGW